MLRFWAGGVYAQTACHRASCVFVNDIGYERLRPRPWRRIPWKQGANMIGAIAGDIIGSVYEFDPIKTKDFPLFRPLCSFTDDTVLTVAIADAILNGRSYLEAVREIGRRYPDAGYGGFFFRWLHSEDSRPYNSWGNGSAMRVSPIGFAFRDEASVLDEAARAAEITHNHPEGVKGA